MKSNLTVIIPTLSNDSGLLYLSKLLYQENIPTIIIDNKPSTKKNKTLQNKYNTYLPQARNIGFAASINLGAKTCQSEWILILNDDIELNPNQTFVQLIHSLVNYANKNKLVAVSPGLVDKQGRVENYGYSVLPHGKVELNLDVKNTKIDGLTAACLLIRRDIFLKVDGFDKQFFAYLEDVDLFLTLKERKYKFSVLPNLTVIHHHLSTSSKMKKGFKQWHDFKNWILLSIKHPHYFKFNLKFFIERLKNLSAIIKNI